MLKEQACWLMKQMKRWRELRRDPASTGIVIVEPGDLSKAEAEWLDDYFVFATSFRSFAPRLSIQRNPVPLTSPEPRIYARFGIAACRRLAAAHRPRAHAAQTR